MFYKNRGVIIKKIKKGNREYCYGTNALLKHNEIKEKMQCSYELLNN